MLIHKANKIISFSYKLNPQKLLDLGVPVTFSLFEIPPKQ